MTFTEPFIPEHQITYILSQCTWNSLKDRPLLDCNGGHFLPGNEEGWNRAKDNTGVHHLGRRDLRHMIQKKEACRLEPKTRKVIGWEEYILPLVRSHGRFWETL